MRLFNHIIEKLEKQIDLLNSERANNGFFRLPKSKITLLGQFSLLVNPKISGKLNIPATMDVDAKIEAEHVIKLAFLSILKSEGLEYDEDSHLIWIPPESTFEVIHESNLLLVTAINPIYGLLSKAIKAKEKNKILVREGLAIFGKPLISLIKQYGGNLEYFLEE